METADPDAGGRDAVALTDADYEALRRVAETYRESLFVRLCGEVGLRPAEIRRLTPADFSRRTTAAGRHHLLALADGDDTGRTAYVPGPVRSELDRYVNERDVGDDEPVFDLTTRRIQMLVAEVADRAAAALDDPRFRDVSSRDLRRYYGRTLLREEGIDPRVVMALGGWDRLDVLLRDDGPVETRGIVDALEGTDLTDGGGRDGFDVERAIGQSGAGVVITDRDGAVEYVNDGFAAMTGFTLDDVAGRDAASVYARDGDVPGARAGDAGETRGSGAATRRPDGDGSPVRLRRADGEDVSAVRRTTAVVDDAGVPVGTVSVFVRPAAGLSSDRPDTTAAEPERLADAIASLRSVNELLPAAADRGEAERRVCERLAANDAYRFAVIAGVNGKGRLEPRTWAGVDRSATEALATVAGSLEGEPCDTAVTTDEVQVVDGLPEGRNGRLDRVAGDGCTVAFVPLTYGETTHGLLVLGTGAPAAFGDEEREVLAGLGWQVGQAVTDIERKKLLLADSVLELTFQVTDEAAFLIDASRQYDATFELEGLVPGDGQSLLYFVTMSGASPDEVLTDAAEREDVERARLIRDYGERCLLEFGIGGEEPATTLTELGGHVTRFVTDGGSQRIEAEFTPKTDVRAVLGGLQSTFETAELLSKQEVERSVQTADGFRRSLEDDLTSKQQSVLTAAYHAEYFEWPRGSTAEELADSIGVSSPTLHNHLRKAQQKLLTAFFDDPEE